MIDIFGLKAYENIKKIPKNTFYKNDGFSKSDEKLLTNEVESIVIMSVLNKNIINIQEYKTDDYHYAEVYFIFVKLKSEKKGDEVIRLIHSIIPNPVVLMLSYHTAINISTAPKRLNKADKNKQVIEEYNISGWIDLNFKDKPANEFLRDLDIINQNFDNFYKFYKSISNKIYFFNISTTTGAYKQIAGDSIEESKAKYGEYKNLEKELIALNSQYKNEISMGAKANVYMQIADKKQKLDELKNQLINL